ncbi:uncharacterized protein spmip7 [Vanacampus margaritifer]
MMASDLDGSKPFSAGLRAIRLLNSRVCRPAGGDRPEPGNVNSTSGSYPLAQHAPLAPKRDDVPLLDPCSWQLSAGAKGRHNFVDFQHVGPTLCVAPHDKQRLKTASRLSKGASYMPVESQLPTVRTADEAVVESSLSVKHDRTQVGQHRIFFTSLPKSLRAEWGRQHLRLRHDAKKPISFCSGCARSGQIPLFTGTICSENMDNIDNMEEDFRPLTLKRSIVPPYTPTARRTTIPGYAGKAAYANTTANSVLDMHRTLETKGRPVFGRVAPLSRMVTTVSPFNPSLLSPTLPVSCARHTKRLWQNK